MNRKILLGAVFAALLSFLTIGRHAQAEISDEERKFLLLYFDENDLAVSATKNPKPVSQIAENMTVITARDIELMNAHTVADILFSIAGVQLESAPSPGIPSPIHIQGSDSRQVRVILDGVTLNSLSDGTVDIGAIPVQNIERVEIIKGPASSTWGSSSGGVINIITKAPTKDTQEMISGSYGGRNTSDTRTQLSGIQGILGYYLSLGRLASGGLQENMAAEHYNAYGKFTLELPKTSMQITMSQDKGRRGLGESLPDDVQFNNRFLNTAFTADMTTRLSDTVTLNAFGSHRRADFNTSITTISSDANIENERILENVTTLGSKVTWNAGSSGLMVTGVDYSKGIMQSDILNGGRGERNELGVYTNYTLSIGSLCPTAGLRYDHTDTNGEFLSPSLGATYSLSRETFFRAVVSRGFSVPPLAATLGTTSLFSPNPSLTLEKVMSYQAGIETHELPYILVKATLFRHNMTDAITPQLLPDGTFTYVNTDRVRRQGVEVEVRTNPFHHVTLFAGYTYNDVTNLDTGARVAGTTKNSADFGAIYDNNGMRGLIRGHYIAWAVDENFTPANGKMVFDVNAQKTVLKNARVRADVFIAIHNIMGTDQYLESSLPNSSRWGECGLRISFL